MFRKIVVLNVPEKIPKIFKKAPVIDTFFGQVAGSQLTRKEHNYLEGTQLWAFSWYISFQTDTFQRFCGGLLL